MNVQKVIQRAREQVAKQRRIEPVRVYSYVRFSTPEQRKGRGGARQNALADAWCQKNGHTLEPANAYADLGLSAFKGKNAVEGSLRRFLDAVKSGKVRPGDILLIESLDRLSRQDVNKAVAILLDIINSGVVVVTLCDNATYRADADPMTLMASLMMSIAVFMRANDESRMKSRRKADSWSHKRELAAKGQYHGGKTPRWIDVVDGKYVLNDYAKTVRHIFTDYVHNGMGWYRLKQKYDIPVPTIAYWVTNPVCVGTLVVNESGAKVEIPNHYPAVIDRKTWDLAQQRRAERFVNRRRGRIGTFANPFAGLLTDPNGERMEVASHNGGQRSYVSPGFAVRCHYLEQVVCYHKLASRFVQVIEVEEAEHTADESKMLAKIDASREELVRTINENPLLATSLTPALKKLEADRRKLTRPATVVREKVDTDVIHKLFRGQQDEASRLKLRDLAQQTIASVKLTQVTNGGWYMMVKGVVATVDGEAVPFAYAYNTRREGFILTDTNTPAIVGRVTDDPEDRKLIQPLKCDTITDELKKRLDLFPLRKRPAGTPNPKAKYLKLAKTA